MANIAGFHAVQTSLLFRTSKFEDHFTPEHRSFRWPINQFLTACQRPSHTSMCRLCLFSVLFLFFLTVNHRGPLPSRELHSTDETWVWRDPRGSWACLRPVSDFEWIHRAKNCHRQAAFLSSFFLSFFFSTTPPVSECGETVGDLGPVYALFTPTNSCHTTCGLATIQIRPHRRQEHQYVCGVRIT